MGDGMNSWFFESMVTAEEENMSGICSKLQEVQRVCEDGGEALYTTIIKDIKPDRDGAALKRIIAKIFERTMSTDAKLAEVPATKSTTLGHRVAPEHRVIDLEGQLADDGTAFENSVSKTSQIEAKLWAQVVVA